MARQTRQQRQQRRKQDGAAPAAAAPPRRPAGPADVATAGGPSPRPAAAPVRRAAERREYFRFLKESIGELRKVEWPTQRQVLQGTVVVLIACVIVGAILFAVTRNPLTATSPTPR